MKTLTPIQLESLIEKSVSKASQDIEFNKNLVSEFTKTWDKSKTKKERFKCLDELFITRKKLISEGKDVTLMDESWLSDLFTGGLGGFKSTFKEWISRKIIGMISHLWPGGINTEIKQALAIGLSNANWSQDWNKFLSPVKNCKFLSDLVVDSLIEYYLDKKVRQTFTGGGVFVDSIRNAVVDGLRNQETVQKIENFIEVPFCNFITKVFGGNTIKNAVNSMTGSQQQGQPQPAV